MSQAFVHGALAEKARIAASLLADILSALPDDMLLQHGDALHAGAKALIVVQHELRERDITDAVQD